MIRGKKNILIFLIKSLLINLIVASEKMIVNNPNENTNIL